MKFLRPLLIALILSASLSPTFAAETTITLSVPGMIWAGCQTSVQKSLEAAQGVKSAAVDLDKKEAVVVYDDQQTNAEALTKATSAAGFESVVKK